MAPLTTFSETSTIATKCEKRYQKATEPNSERLSPGDMQLTPRLALRLACLLAILTCVVSQRGYRPVTCQAGFFSKCETASIQCHFNKDLNLTKHNFNVVRYPFDRASSDASGASGTYVLLCNWQQQGGRPECKVEDDYSFNYVVSDRLTLDIPDVTRKVEGKYLCQLVPDDDTKTETCTLTIRDEYPKTLPAQPASQTANNDSVTIAILVLVIIFLVSFFAFVAVYVRTHYSLVTKSSQRNAPMLCKLPFCLKLRASERKSVSEKYTCNPEKGDDVTFLNDISDVCDKGNMTTVFSDYKPGDKSNTDSTEGDHTANPNIENAKSTTGASQENVHVGEAARNQSTQNDSIRLSEGPLRSLPIGPTASTSAQDPSQQTPQTASAQTQMTEDSMAAKRDTSNSKQVKEKDCIIV